ncbi:MAG: cobalamin B12-binding domain-containing protein [Clostridia bacterium]|nr:cobalamin B12-binding domain-containing protein [Clostridia bacterium]
MLRPIKVLIAKPGLDGHDRGAKVVSRALRDAGMEVIYTGLFQTPDEVVEAALQEDVDVLGLSILSGAHMTLIPRIMDLLKENKAEDILLVPGGTIVQKEEINELLAKGVPVVFGPDTPLEQIVTFIKENAKIA